LKSVHVDKSLVIHPCMATMRQILALPTSQVVVGVMVRSSLTLGLVILVHIRIEAVVHMEFVEIGCVSKPRRSTKDLIVQFLVGFG